MSLHKVALLSGSLRKQSTNTGLLRAIVELKHPSFQFQWINIHNFPIFNEDTELQGIPKEVSIARKQIYKADAVLVGLPEYNFSMSSPFKTAFDWFSRSYKNSETDKVAPIAEKIIGTVSSGGGKGGLRSQSHFKESFVTLFKMKWMQCDETNLIAVQRFSGPNFNENGDVINEEIRKKLTVFLNSYDSWITKHKL